MKEYFSKRLLPVITIDKAESAVPLVEAVQRAGLNIMEITLRTPAALEAIHIISSQFPDFQIGAGTILDTDQLKRAIDAGARFGLAPGFNPKIVKEAHKAEFPFIPGVLTPSEVELALESGCKILKLFPVNLLGGTEYIKSLEGPFKSGGIHFIPMGGITMQNMKHYLQCKSVLAVGGSWLAPRILIEDRDFNEISVIVSRSVAVTLS